MRVLIYSIFCLITLVGCDKTTEMKPSFSLDDIKKISLAVTKVDERIPDLKRTTFFFLHRKQHHNLYITEIEDYINRNGKLGLLKGLCDFREIGSSFKFSLASGEASENQIRYTHIFLFMSSSQEERKKLLPYGIEEDDLNELVANRIKEIINSIEED